MEIADDQRGGGLFEFAGVGGTEPDCPGLTGQQIKGGIAEMSWDVAFERDEIGGP